MKSILIIDDNPTSRSIFLNVLQNLDYQLIESSNGIDGIRKALKYNPQLVIIDEEMPFLNGYGTMKIFELLQLQIPSIFISSHDDIDQRVQHYPSITNTLSRSQIYTGLLSLVQNVLKNINRNYTDHRFTLRQKEVLDRIGFSDRKKILVVEDSAIIMNTILNYLDQTDLYELYRAPDGQEALIKACFIEPDLILSDIIMPKIDGLTMAQIFYILGRPFPLAFITAKSDIETMTQVQTLESVQGFLIKKDILKNIPEFLARVEEMTHLDVAEKQHLQSVYQTPSIEILKASGENKGVLAS